MSLQKVFVRGNITSRFSPSLDLPGHSEKGPLVEAREHARMPGQGFRREKEGQGMPQARSLKQCRGLWAITGDSSVAVWEPKGVVEHSPTEGVQEGKGWGGGRREGVEETVKLGVDVGRGQVLWGTVKK